MNPTPIAWASNILQRLGYAMKNNEPECIIQAPWSTVYRFETNAGYFFLKVVPAGLNAEPSVIAFLREKYHASVPVVIANNFELHCFLMKDAGIPLRQYLKQTFDRPMLINAIHRYIELQQESIPDINALIALGVPDWRIEKLPACYEKLIQQTSLLSAGGLSTDQIKKLTQLVPYVKSICHSLLQYPIPNTFSQTDCHDNNILIQPDTKKTTLVDLGEVSVTHPFFSLSNMLMQLKEKHGIDQHTYESIKHAMLQPWLSYATEKQLLEVMSLIQQCWPVFGALGAEYCLRHVEKESAERILIKIIVTLDCFIKEHHEAHF